jgi:Cu/Ag efflux protein CusF
MKKPVHTLAAAMFTVILSLSAATAQGNAVQGEVRKIDEAAGKVTLKHGPIKNLGMDVGMTMTFRVKDPAMLREVQVGDKVEFEAEGVRIYGYENAEEQLTAASTSPRHCSVKP